MNSAAQIALNGGISSLHQLHTLEVLADSTSPLTQTEIATIVNLSTGGITGIIDVLESAQLAERQPVPGDRRKLQVIPTEKGLNLIHSIRKFLTSPT